MADRAGKSRGKRERSAREIDPTFGRNLDAALSRADAPTGKQVADKSGIGETDLSRIRNAQRMPNVMLAARIARAAGVSLDELTKPLPTRASSAIEAAVQEVQGPPGGLERRAQETQLPGGRRKSDPPPPA